MIVTAIVIFVILVIRVIHPKCSDYPPAQVMPSTRFVGPGGTGMLVGVLHCVLRFFENREVAEGTLEIYMA